MPTIPAGVAREGADASETVGDGDWSASGRGLGAAGERNPRARLGAETLKSQRCRTRVAPRGGRRRGRRRRLRQAREASRSARRRMFHRRGFDRAAARAVAGGRDGARERRRRASSVDERSRTWSRPISLALVISTTRSRVIARRRFQSQGGLERWTCGWKSERRTRRGRSDWR